MMQTLAAWYGAWLWRNFERASRNPEAVQRRLLANILHANADTAFGRSHGFSSIKSLAEYQQAVPIRTFKGLSAWVDRIEAGEPAVLTRDPVVFFNQSSGTSGKQKLIPVTRQWIQDTGRLRMTWGALATQAHPGLMSGKTVSVVYAASGGNTSGGIEYGSLSGRVFLQSPKPLRQRYALPYAIARIADPESKQYAAMRMAVSQEVSFLFSTNPATVLAMLETAERRQDELLRDIHEGTLSEALLLPPGVREDLLGLCRPDAQAARRLAALAAQNSGRLRPMDYWPNCAVFGCWLGSTVGVAARRIPDWFSPSLALRDVGLAASEGVFTLPIQDNVPYGPLTVASNVYEFIPVADADQDDPPVLAAWELEVGAEYVLVITTLAGLYRYNINDVVRVAGKFNATPMLEFVRKGSDNANLAGEKMDVAHLLEAVDKAQKATGLHIAHFRVQADPQQMRYRFYLELSGGVPVDSLDKLADELEQSLQAANAYYAKWINEKQLLPSTVCLMQAGWFDRYVNAAITQGARHGQFKPALLTLQPEPAHEIVARTAE